MYRIIIVILLAGAISGCASSPIPSGQAGLAWQENPIVVTNVGHDLLWEVVVNVIDDYFPIEHEEPVRLIGDILTEGQLTTEPQVAATLLEPWRPDSVGYDERLESTLQSMRRWATVRATPTQGGYSIEVAVYKELEDVKRPEHSTAGSATFRYDDSINEVVRPVGEERTSRGWIPQGRDSMLEQRILGHLRDAFYQMGITVTSGTAAQPGTVIHLDSVSQPPGPGAVEPSRVLEPTPAVR